MEANRHVRTEPLEVGEGNMPEFHKRDRNVGIHVVTGVIEKHILK